MDRSPSNSSAYSESAELSTTAYGKSPFFANSQNKINQRQQSGNAEREHRGSSSSTPVLEELNSNSKFENSALECTIKTTTANTSRSDRRFRCSHCTKLCPTLAELVRHQKKHEKTDNLGNNPYSPNESLMLISDRGGLVSTVISEANDGNKQYKCSNCFQSFTNFLTLTRHLNYNCLSVGEEGAEKAYSCQYCHRVFSGILQLKTHIPTHTKTYKCTLCGKALSRYSRLRGHSTTPNGQSTFNCEHCHRPLGQNDIFCATSKPTLRCANRLRSPSPPKKVKLRKSIRV